MRLSQVVFVLATALAMLLFLPIFNMFLDLGGVSVYTIGLYISISCIMGLIASFNVQRTGDKTVETPIEFNNREQFTQNIIEYFDNSGFSYNKTGISYNFYPDINKLSSFLKKLYNMVGFSNLNVKIDIHDHQAIITTKNLNRTFIKSFKRKYAQSL